MCLSLCSHTHTPPTQQNHIANGKVFVESRMRIHILRFLCSGFFGGCLQFILCVLVPFMHLCVGICQSARSKTETVPHAYRNTDVESGNMEKVGKTKIYTEMKDSKKRMGGGEWEKRLHKIKLNCINLLLIFHTSGRAAHCHMYLFIIVSFCVD